MIKVRVVEKKTVADDICAFELARADGAPLPAFTAGAHIDVHITDGLIRQYSLCNPPGEQHRYVIAVLRDPKSRGGAVAMHDRVHQGDTIRISEPRNLFVLDETATRTLLFAGGIGITPILAMAERLSALGRDFELHYCARSENRMAFADQVRAAFRGRAFCHLDDGGADQKLNTSAVLGPPQRGTHLYVCGPGPFIDHILGTAIGLGWRDANLHREYFAAEPVANPDGDGAFEIEIASSGVVFTVGAEQRAIDVLADNGIEIPMSCEQGICGTCITRVIAGEPDHRDMFMTNAEHAANDRFTPCCSRAKSARLVLDL